MKPAIEGIKNLHEILGLEVGCFSPEEMIVLLCRVCATLTKFSIYIDIGTPGTGKSSTLSFLVNDKVKVADGITTPHLFGNKSSKTKGIINEDYLVIDFDERSFSSFEDDTFANIKTYTSGKPVRLYLSEENVTYTDWNPSLYFSKNFSNDEIQNILLKNPSAFYKGMVFDNISETDSFAQRTFIVPSFLIRPYMSSMFIHKNNIKNNELFLKKIVEKRNESCKNISKIFEKKDILIRESEKLSNIWRMLELIFDFSLDNESKSNLKIFEIIADFIIEISKFKYIKIQNTIEGKKLIAKLLPLYLENSSLKDEVPENFYFFNNRLFIIIGKKLAKLAINIRGLEENKQEFKLLKEENYKVKLECFDNLLIQDRLIPNLDEDEAILAFYEESPNLMLKTFMKIKENMALENEKRFEIIEKTISDLVLYNIHQVVPPIVSNDTGFTNYPKANKVKFKNAVWAKNTEGEDVIFSLFK